MIKHSKFPKFEYNKINHFIYIGTNVCCQTHFDNRLLKKRIKADISLEKIRLDQPFGVEYYLWLPTADHEAPTLRQLIVGVNFLQELEKQKIKVYVHCQNGHGRAPSLVAAYFISKGKSVDEAIKIIKSKRKTIHPNKKQITTLNNFKRQYK